MKHYITTFKDDEYLLEVVISTIDNSIWLTTKDIASLFDKSVRTIRRFVQTIYQQNASPNGQKCDKNVAPIIKHIKGTNYYGVDVITFIGKSCYCPRFEKFILWANELKSKRFSLTESNRIRFEVDNIVLDVNVSPQENTVWLSLMQIAELYEKDVSVIRKHISNIYNANELERGQTCAKNALVQKEGNKTVTRMVDYYNLDMILSVGYRTSGKRAVEFRRWATGVLKEYLLKGYAIDPSRASVTIENFVRLENKVDSIREELIKKIEDVEIRTFENPIKEKLFYGGEYFDSYSFVNSILSKATKSVTIIDPYFDSKGLVFLKEMYNEIKVTICISDKSTLKEEHIELFKKQYFDVDIVKSNSFHDRFIIIDDSICYGVGTSFNYMSKSAFIIYKIDTPQIANNIIALIRDRDIT